MVAPTKRNVQLAAAFLAIANRYTAPGWIEYLLWETVEGLRDRPFSLLEALTNEEMDVLRNCRDKGGFWFRWTEKWEPVPIAEWKEHTRTTTSEDIYRSLSGA